MNLEAFTIPAFTATLLFLISLAFVPSPLQAVAKASEGSELFSSSDSGNTACDLPPYSETLSKDGTQVGSKLAELPPLDSHLPAKVATATFAMG